MNLAIPAITVITEGHFVIESDRLQAVITTEICNSRPWNYKMAPVISCNRGVHNEWGNYRLRPKPELRPRIYREYYVFSGISPLSDRWGEP